MRRGPAFDVAAVALPEGFTLHAFEALGVDLLYAIMVLRQRAFVVEQDCVYLDADGRDQHALHLVHRTDGVVDAYARIFLAPNDEVGIGRVVTAPEVRGTGLGHRLVDAALLVCDAFAGEREVHIEAQAHLEAWYSKHRFETISDIYLIDGIDHFDMVRRR